MKKHLTIIDIAKELGISKSTVSRAFNDKYDVNPETRKAVLEYASKVNFHPNPHAANLVNQQTKMIGIVVPEFINSFFPRIIISIQNTLAREGFNVLITQSNEDPEIEVKNLRMLLKNRVEGILLSCCRGYNNTDLYNEIISDGTPLVFFSRDCPSVEASRVKVDDYQLARTATEALIDCTVADDSGVMLHLHGPEFLPSSEIRCRGWRDALSENGFDSSQCRVVKCDGITIEDGFSAMKRWIEINPGIKPATILAFNDPLAIGAMKALKAAGIRIPEDTKIMGFSESKSALIVEPPLSSVAQPLEEMGVTAAQLILTKIKKPNTPDKEIILEGRINLRESTLKSVRRL